MEEYEWIPAMVQQRAVCRVDVAARCYQITGVCSIDRLETQRILYCVAEKAPSENGIRARRLPVRHNSKYIGTATFPEGAALETILR